MELGNDNNSILFYSAVNGGAQLNEGATPNDYRLRNISSNTFPPTLSNNGATADFAKNGDIYLVREA